MAFMFGGEADNHAVNTVPKETLVKVIKAEDGGPGGKGTWPATRTISPNAGRAAGLHRGRAGSRT